MNIPFPPSSSKKRGFTLLEMTVVLGIVGAVLSGIWVVVTASRSDMLSVQLNQQTALIVNNVRSYYAGRALPTGAIAAGTFTSTMRDASVFPGDMCNTVCMAGTTNPVNPFGGTATIAIPAGAVTEFQIVYGSVPKKACISVAEALSQNATSTGLTWMKINAGSDITSFPATVSQLTSNCSASSTIRVQYRIRL